MRKVLQRHADEIAAEQICRQGTEGKRRKYRVQRGSQPPAQPCTQRRAYSYRDYRIRAQFTHNFPRHEHTANERWGLSSRAMGMVVSHRCAPVSPFEVQEEIPDLVLPILIHQKL